jgi:hypothetical protein
MAKIFEGESYRNDISEALSNALEKAKEQLSANHISWSLDFVRGGSGGFTGADHLQVGIAASATEAETKEDAYFEMRDFSVSEKAFVLKLTDPDLIAHARRVLDGTETDRIHVSGTIVDKPADYNPGWSFHIDPASLDFFEVAIEVCDANADYIEGFVSKGQGSPLPDSHWCPWSSMLTKEIDGRQFSLVEDSARPHAGA